MIGGAAWQRDRLRRNLHQIFDLRLLHPAKRSSKTTTISRASPLGVGTEWAVIAVISLSWRGLMEFFSSWYFMGIMAALLIGLIGLLLYLRKQGSGD